MDKKEALRKAKLLGDFLIQSGFLGEYAAMQSSLHRAIDTLAAAGAYDVAEELEPLRLFLDGCIDLERSDK